jgi:DNA-binding MarR family transcriptional regulator
MSNHERNSPINNDLSQIVRFIYENFEMLSRWTPDFTAKEFLVILALRGNQQLRISEVVQLTGFSYSTASWLVDSLVKKRIVSRRRHSNDRRVVLVKLTSRGHEALGEYDRIFDDIAALLDDVLSEKEQELFLKLSRKIIDKLGEKNNSGYNDLHVN